MPEFPADVFWAFSAGIGATLDSRDVVLADDSALLLVTAGFCDKLDLEGTDEMKDFADPVNEMLVAAEEAALPLGIRRPVPGPKVGVTVPRAWEGNDTDAERRFECDAVLRANDDFDGGTGEPKRLASSY